MTELYQQAHDKVRRHLRAEDDDVVVFCGSGATGAINKLVRAIGLLVPEPVERAIKVKQQFAEADRAVVFISRMEHHSNDLPWRESIADVVMVGFDPDGRVSATELDALLSDPRYRDRPFKLGSFSAASNVTGIKNDVDALARTMHKHGGFACFDYAAAAPYTDVDLHPNGDPALRKDAVFISMHKFLGGPQAPGLLVANKRLFRSRVPVEPGGGTVVYTSPWDWRYTDELSHREEGGTPNVVGVIRAGLAIELKEIVGTSRMQRVEDHLVARARERFSQHENVLVLGGADSDRLGILSIIVDEGALHYNLAARILSDRWGLQTRGGCMCAGTYGHDLLGISAARSFEISCGIERGDATVKPGWTRISFSPATSNDEMEVLLDAVSDLARNWRQYATDYQLNPTTATWRHKAELASDAPQTASLKNRLLNLSGPLPSGDFTL
jgi:selenocysteine lyase/cysteine desulfurase